MADPARTPHVARLPTLTEVVTDDGWPAATDAGTPADAPPLASPAPPAPLAAQSTAAAPPDEARIVEAVLAGLQQRIDLMFEYRLREALAPLLAQAADALVRDARHELAHTLRDIVARAVAQELGRQRNR